jgi:hypothetical protein
MGQQLPPQLVHLMMASWSETCSVQIIERDECFVKCELSYIDEIVQGR